MTNLFNYSLDSQTLTNCGLVVIDNIASLLTPLLGAEGSNFPKISGQISAVKTRYGHQGIIFAFLLTFLESLFLCS